MYHQKKFLLVILMLLFSSLFFAVELDLQKNNSDVDTSLKVTYNLSGILNSINNKELAVTFNKDMLPLGGKRNGGKILFIVPKIKGTFQWRGTRTLVFRPARRFKFSTRYEVTIKKGTGALEGGKILHPITWTFTTPVAYPMQVKTETRTYWGAESYFQYISEFKTIRNLVLPGDRIYLKFDQPVSARKIRHYLFIKRKDGKQTRGVDDPLSCGKGDGAENVISVELPSFLEKGTDYILVLRRGFMGREGNFGTPEDFRLHFKTVQQFKFVGQRFKVIRPDDRGVELVFSNGLQHLLENEITLFLKEREDWKRSDDFTTSELGKKLVVFPGDGFKPGDSMQIRINKEIKDIYGMNLGEEVFVDVNMRTVEPQFCVDENCVQPELYMKGIKEMKCTVTRYNDSLLDLYAENMTTWDRNKILDVANNRELIDWQRSFIINPEDVGIHHCVLDFKEREGASGISAGKSRGVFGFKIDNMVIPDSNNKREITSFAEYITGKPNYYYKKDMEFVVRNGKKNSVFWVYRSPDKNDTPVATNGVENRVIGVPDAEITIYRPPDRFTPGKTKENGVLLSGFLLKKDDLVVIKDPVTGERIFHKISVDISQGNYQLGKDEPEIYASVFTDRELYRPGDTVNINGVIKIIKDKKIHSPSFRDARLVVLDPKRNTCSEELIKIDELGGFSFAFKTDENCKQGEYKVHLYDKDDFIQDCDFRVFYYDSGTIRLEMSELKKVYGPGDRFDPVVSGKFFSGTPMTNGTIDYSLDCYSFFDPSFFVGMDNRLENYSFLLDERLCNDPNPIQSDMNWGKNGACKLSIDLKNCKYGPRIGLIEIDVTGSTEEGKESSIGETAYFFPGKRVVGLKGPDMAVVNSDISVDTVAFDISGKGVSTRASVTVLKSNEFYNNKWDTVKAYKDLFLKNIDSFKFRVSEPGEYIVRCDAVDDEGNMVSTSVVVFVRESRFNGSSSFSMKPDKNVYNVGETARFTFSAPNRGTILLTVEQDEILEYYLIAADEEYFELKIKKNYFQHITVNATAVLSDGSIWSDYCDLMIIDFDKKLNVDISTKRGAIPPGEKSTLTVRVTDKAGNGKKAKLLVYAVNEGNLQLSYYHTPDLFSEFYYYNRDLFFDRDFIDVFSSKGCSLPFLDIPLRAPMGGVLAGKVTDTTGKPLQGVAVTLMNRKFLPPEDETLRRQTTTGETGHFLLGRLRKGSYYVCFRKKGYETIEENYYCDGGNRTMMDISLPRVSVDDLSDAGETLTGHAILQGCVKIKMDDAPVPGVYVTLVSEDGKIRFKSITDANGYYRFAYLKGGKYRIELMLEGFKGISRIVTISKKTNRLDVDMELKNLNQQVLCTSGPSLPESLNRSSEADTRPLTTEELSAVLRKDFQELLFFKKVETDERGQATIEFTASDTLTNYRVTCVAYTEDRFGTGESGVIVGKDLYLEEAMPEFARHNDRFTAGVLLGNKTENSVQVGVGGIPEGITMKAPTHRDVRVNGKSNGLVQFEFEAPRVGDAEVKFYARSNSLSDALLKTLPVLDNKVSEGVVDFSIGRNMRKQVVLPKNVSDSRLKVGVSASILEPSAKIASRLMSYPYDCLEQRTSKIMPFLIYEDDFLRRLKISVDKEHVLKKIKEYIDSIPKFQYRSGGLCYYRSGKFPSPFLTVYVMWALRLAQQNGYTVDEELMDTMHEYLGKDENVKGVECFYQYILSLKNEADKGKLEKLYGRRNDLSLWERVFLYKAIHIQLKDKGKTNGMLSEFNNGLQIESDFAYFDVEEFEYNRDFPFYSSRFCTALLLQAILEVEGGHPHAHAIMNGLLAVPDYYWNTTQNNFQVLCAMHEYAQTVEKGEDIDVNLEVLGEKNKKQYKKRLNRGTDTIEMEKNLDEGEKETTVKVNADDVVYLTTEQWWMVEGKLGVNHGVDVRRVVYDENGVVVDKMIKGGVYQVELLIRSDKEVPYGVIDEPLAAGFELLRWDLRGTRNLQEFNDSNAKKYPWQWVDTEYSKDRTVYYTYLMSGKMRLVYFVKALYTGTFTWMPTTVQGMYHPQYYGRTGKQTLVVKQ